ncbi:unnamed protein product [Leptosia nina]|uniref:Alpha-1,3-glucosyltransferase n=1 Tax=Leptosia nina TaxID=320188 RepID=A0AAV1JQP5_9NEOP
MISQITLIVSAVKLLFMPLYRSTDFEVHRNWLAITHNKSVNEWYYETTSEWTLDYPPLFAWLEFCLSHIAKYFDPEMLKIENINYASEATVLFQRASVIMLDCIYIYSVKKCADLLDNGKLLVFILLISNPGLLIVDHIHFQYNGFLFGFLLISVAYMIKSDYIRAALWFAILLNFKHIFMYIAPVYVIYLLRAYCFTVSSTDGIHTAWYSFSFANLVKLGAVVIGIFAISFGPFIQHLPQLFSRLFPFKRGLCHAYWAPNFWALYNFADKALQIIMKKFGGHVASDVASMTGGLVQEFEHSVLPSIRPSVTFVVTIASMLPALIKLWHLGADTRSRGISFVRCITICAMCSFMFGWHVHEKAILMVLIPLSFLSVLGQEDGKFFLFLSTVGHYSLFPLLYPKNLAAIKFFLLLPYTKPAHLSYNIYVTESLQVAARERTVLLYMMGNMGKDFSLVLLPVI